MNNVKQFVKNLAYLTKWKLLYPWSLKGHSCHISSVKDVMYNFSKGYF